MESRKGRKGKSGDIYMNDKGFIKLHRQVTIWEWWHKPATRLVFITCLLSANWKDCRFEGRKIPRGSFVTSLSRLSADAGVTIRQARTALRDLQMTNELTCEPTSKYTVITVNNYDLYQGRDTADDKQTTSERQTDDKQTTTIEEYKNIRNKEYISHGDEPHLFGVYNNVRLTHGEMQELMKQYPEDYKDMIENLSTYMRSKGKLYDDHYATMMKWKHEDEIKAQEAKKAETYDYRKDVI